jgi:hypothetical protein
MRVLAILAFGVFSAAMLGGEGAANAADCTKGMMWPYVRSTGDCLTDAEIQAGKSGAYTGAVNTNPDLADIKPSPAAVPVTTSTSSNDGSWYWPFGGGSSNSAAQPARTTATRGGAVNVQCHKAALWPFVREAGDCLTDNEKKSGQTGVYGGGSGIPAPTATATAPTTATAANGAPAPAGGAPDNTGAANTGAANTGSANSGQTATSENSPPACTKGVFWPFVRRTGDCPTDSEKK